MYQVPIILVMLNKLRCHAHFEFLANQNTWSRLWIYKIFIKSTYWMTNSADPDQLASLEANWSGSTLFAKAGFIRLSRTRVKMPCPLQIFSQSEYLIQIVDINPHTEWQTVQIQISCLQSSSEKPTDLDLYCLQWQGISRFSRTRIKSCSITFDLLEII